MLGKIQNIKTLRLVFTDHEKDNCMLPLMSDTDACPKVIIDKIKCGYKTGCTRKCSCRILGIECTLNCNNCIENCSNKTYNVEDVD